MHAGFNAFCLYCKWKTHYDHRHVFSFVPWPPSYFLHRQTNLSSTWRNLSLEACNPKIFLPTKSQVPLVCHSSVHFCYQFICVIRRRYDRGYLFRDRENTRCTPTPFLCAIIYCFRQPIFGYFISFAKFWPLNLWINQIPFC